jgi:hypothetical protein
MGGNDSLLRMIGETAEIDCPSLSKTAQANDVLRGRVVRTRNKFNSARALPAYLTMLVFKVLLYFSAYWCQRKFWSHGALSVARCRVWSSQTPWYVGCQLAEISRRC